MIAAVGNDLVEVERIRQALDDPVTGRRFRRRVFTEREQRYCDGQKSRYESYAARFAAKEAVMKALGAGWGRHAGWRDVEVVRQPGSRPAVVLHGRAKEFAERAGVARIHLALTHTAKYALAQVTAEA